MLGSVLAWRRIGQMMFPVTRRVKYMQIPKANV